MDWITFSSLLMLAFSGSVTPGPNNALLSSSGMNFGYPATMPHAWGIIFGHSIMEFSVALGLGTLYQSVPNLATILQIVAVAILSWLAYQIATAPVDDLGNAQQGRRPWRFHEGFFFQWINPKAWLVAIGVSGQYASGENTFEAAAYIGAAIFIASIASTQIWTGFGVSMARILNTPGKRRFFNLAMAGLIILSVFLLLGFGN